MPFKVLIAPDKFKGTLTATAAADAMAKGWRKARPKDALELLPISDGGDGFGEVMAGLIGAKVQFVATVDAAHRRCVAKWWWDDSTQTAMVESANVIGLAMLPPKKFHPFELDTFGLGELIRAAANKGARRCIIGIGGSATNDGGFGLARSLDWKFLDHEGNTLERWTDLHKLARVERPERSAWFRELIVAVDVQNPLLGQRGATRVYGPQKGLKPRQLGAAERNLRRLAEVIARTRVESRASVARRTKLHEAAGAGAAGGLGFGLLTFLNGRLESGFELFARLARLDRRLRGADIVITGEGCVDASTLMGKGVGSIAQRCKEMKLSCVALAGAVTERKKVSRAFAQVMALTDITSSKNAISNPAFWLERLARRCAEEAKA